MDVSHIGRWPPDSSTIFGLGILAGVALFWWTGVPEVGLIAAARSRSSCRNIGQVKRKTRSMWQKR